MPSIKVKTEFIEKLKALDAYDAWLANVKIQYDKYGECFHGQISTFYDLISLPLLWEETPEGHDYWKKIADY